MPEPETDLRSRACSPAQTDRSKRGEQPKSHWGEQDSKVSARNEQNRGEQAVASNEVSKLASLSDKNGERRGEEDDKDREAAGAQPLRASQWLKSILPEATNGWWDVREKGAGATVKFRWRDPKPTSDHPAERNE